MFISFAICPDSSTPIPLDPADIELNVIHSQHFHQSNLYRAVLLWILNFIQSKLALPYTSAPSSHVGEVTPGIGAMPRSTSLSSLATVHSLTDRMTGTTSEFLNYLCGHSLMFSNNSKDTTSTTHSPRHACDIHRAHSTLCAGAASFRDAGYTISPVHIYNTGRVHYAG